MTSPVHPGPDVGSPIQRIASRQPPRRGPRSSAQSQAPPAGARVYPPERWLLRRMLGRLGNPAIRVALWDGQEITTSDQTPVATVRIRDRRTLLGLIVNPEVQFGDAYTDGRIEVEGDLLELLQAVFRAMWPTITATGSLRGRLLY